MAIGVPAVTTPPRQEVNARPQANPVSPPDASER